MNEVLTLTGGWQIKPATIGLLGLTVLAAVQLLIQLAGGGGQTPLAGRPWLRAGDKDGPSLNRSSFLSIGVLGLLLACEESPSPMQTGLQVEEWNVHPLPTDARFLAVRDMILLGDHLWVLDGAPPFLARISLKTGEFSQFGNEGDGPGEFLAPWAIQPTSDSAGILVWDFGSYRVSEFGPTGTYESSVMMSQEGRILARSNFRDVSYTDPFRVRWSPRGYLAGSFDRRLDHTADFSGGSIRVSSLRLDPGQDVLHFQDFIEPGLDDMKEWASVPFWDACEGNMVVWAPASGEIVWFGQDGTVLVRSVLELPTHPIDHQDIERYLERMARLEMGPNHSTQEINFSAMARRNRHRFAGERPLVTDLRCQGVSSAWVRLFSTAADPLGRGSEWLALGIDGPSRRVRVPADFTPLLFTSQGHFGTSELLGGDQVIAHLSPPAMQLSERH